MADAAIEVEVVGAHLGVPELSCEAGGRRFVYVAEPTLKRGRSFRFGAFFSKGALGEDVDRYPRNQRVAVLAESPINACYRDVPRLARRFPLVFTHQAELLRQGLPYLPLLFGTNWLGVRDAAESQRVLEEHPDKSAMVSFIGSLEHPDTGAYRFRREIAEFLVARGRIDCFGRGLRPIEGKREALAPYRFSVAMENASADDYFTEKLIDCLLMQTVPIYYGWPSIGDHFDARGFLVFRDREELAAILDRLSPELYESMRPFAIENKRIALQRRWHSHLGLFERLSEQIPAAMLGSDPVPYRPVSRFGAFTRRLLDRVGLER